MRDSIRAELLKARSGFWLLLVLSYALLLPLVAWQFSGVDVTGADPATATRLVLGCVAACPVAATFLGCYLVTREYYYRSVERTVLLHRKGHVFTAKLLAGVVSGLVVGVVGAAGWSAVAAFVLRGDFAPSAGAWRLLAGCVAACAVAGAFGVAIGWIVPNYYLATAASLVVPFAVEVPLVTLAPAVGRFLPNSALAGITGVPVEGLLTGWVAAPVALAWCAVAVLAGRWLFERREIG